MRKFDITPWIKSNWEKIIIFFLMLVTYNQWIFHSGYLVAGDWIFHNREFLLEFYRMPQMWDTFWNFGSVDIMPVIDVPQFLYGVLAHFFDYALLERIVYFWPILIFSYFGILKLGKMIFQEDKIGLFFFALLFLFNTYILSVQTSFITYASVYALSPITFYLFIKLLTEKFSVKNVLFAALILLLCSFYEPRGLVALSYFLSLYFLYILLTAKKLKMDATVSFITAYVVFIVLNFYWILPQIFLAEKTGVISLQTVFVPFNSILDAFSFHNYAWSGNLFDDFSMVAFQKITSSFYFFIITVLTFSPVLFYKKLRYQSLVFFLLSSSLVGVFLLKQQNQPFGAIYEWLFYHLPTFNLFRESNKFILFLLPISLLFGLSVSFLESKIKAPSTKMVFLVLVSSLVLINIRPILNQQIQGVFINRSMPEDYITLNQFILNQETYSRSLFVPRSSNWAINTNNHPKISQVDMVENWVDTNSKIPTDQKIIDMFERDYSDALLNISSVGYVIVPIKDTANDDDFFKYYGEREFFVEELDKVSYLKRIDIGTEELVVYENENFRPHIYATEEAETIYDDVPFEKVDFQFKNPTEYSVNLKNISKPTYINFSEKYHPDWKIRAGEFQWLDVLTQKNYFLPDAFHSENNALLNSFLIDSEYIKRNFPKDAYTMNPDGSLNLDLILYFKPQAYFYLGLIISGTTLASCLGYLGWVGMRSRKQKKNQNEL